MRESWRRQVFLSPSGEGGEGGGGSGGGAGTLTLSEEDLAKRITAAVDEKTAGLRKTKDELIDEKRKLREQFDGVTKTLEQLGGADGIKHLLEVRERLSKDELGKLLADGKYEEWLEKRTKSMRSEAERQLAALTRERDEANTARDALRVRLQRREIETTIRAACTRAKVVDTAVEDALLLAYNVWSVDDDGTLVIKDEETGILPGKDGKTPKTPDEWLEEQRESRRHWFPPSKGAGAEGGRGAGSGPRDLNKLGTLSMEDYRKERANMGLGTGVGGHPL